MLTAAQDQAVHIYENQPLRQTLVRDGDAAEEWAPLTQDSEEDQGDG
jgi:hypothetical protein